MTVLEVEGSNAKCSHFKGVDATHIDEWFPFDHLELIRKAEGGWIG